MQQDTLQAKKKFQNPEIAFLPAGVAKQPSRLNNHIWSVICLVNLVFSAIITPSRQLNGDDI